ncbi:MAG TPA: hypothetical protein VHI98_24835, partial [Vicinamibacterales bacterium]|nr:hypothetical protein [Vicinamibacterales bacterium]
MKPRLVASCLACVMAISAHAFLHAQQSPHGGANVKPQPGPNINAAAGIFDPTDPAALVKADVQMQRQNEIVLAASVRNADHLLAAGNDYRFVDFPQDQFFGGNMTIFTRLFAKLFGMPERRLPSRSAASIGAWTGVYRSCNRGRSWIGGAVPGSPLDFSEASLASPIKAFSNAAAAQGGHAETTDAVLVPGPAGRMHLIVLAFVRFPNGSVGESRMYHVSYTDRNNHEGGTCFNYDRTTEIDRSTAHVTSSVPAPFLDKGAMAVDQDGTLYVAYTVFMEGENSKVVVARSTNGGATWTKTTPLLTLGFLRNHGTTLTVDPLNGTVYLAWRLFYDKWPMMVVSKSYDKGRTFLPATPISHWWPSKSLKDIVKQLKASKLRPFDQFTSEPGPPETATARSLAFPHLVSGVVNGRSKLFAVWQERVDVNPGSATFGQPLATGSPRIVMSMSIDGGWSWTARKAVDAGSRTEHLEQPGVGPIVTRPSGPQVQPALNISGTTNPQLAVLYHEARDELAQPFENNFISGIGRRMDVRIARLNPATGQLVAPSVQVSQYPIKANSSPAELAETAPGYKKVHRPNLTMYSGGQRAFFGDYPALASSQVFETGTPWKWAIEASSLLAMWTDNRDVQFPLNPVTLEPDINAPWTGYQAIKPIDPTDPGTPQPSSCGQVATRNANPYFAEIAGLVAGAPQTFKPLNIQRSFVTYFENRTPEDRFFRLTLQDNEAGGVDGSFDQFSFTEADDVRDVKIFANSGHTRTLWVQPSANQTASVRVIAQEIVALGGALKTGGLRARVILNPDPTNHALTEVPPTAPGFGGATIEDSEIHNPQISSPQISTFSNRAPQISSPQISTPQISSPQISTPQISTPGEAGPQISSPQISTPAVGGEVNGMDVTFTVKNQGNTTTQYEALLNVPSVQELIASGNYQFQLIVTRTSLVPGFVQTAMGCEPALVPKVQVISNVPIPQISSPQISTISNPQISSPQISTPQISTFWVEPEGGAEGQNSHGDEGNEDAHSTVVPDEVKITLRATRLTPMAAGGPTFTPEQAADVVARVDSVSTNVVDGIVQPEGSQPGAITFPDLVVANYVPAAATLTTAPGGQVTLSAWRHQNQGTAPANAADETISAGFYLSTDAVITASDVRLGGIVN